MKGGGLEKSESRLHLELRRNVGNKRCWETQRGYEKRLAMKKLDIMESVSHLSKTDILNVWKIFHLIHLNGKGNQRKQEAYIRSQTRLELTREEYESIVGLEQNRYRDEIGCLFNKGGQTSITFEELCDLFSSMSKSAKIDDKIKLAFCLFDLDRDNKLDKTDLGNIVLRLVFDFPPLLERVWDKVEPQLSAHEHTEEERKALHIIVEDMIQGLKVADPPYEMDEVEALVIAVELNSYVEEALDEASHDIYDESAQQDLRAIHYPEFKRALERNPDFRNNFTIPIVPPMLPKKVETRARETFNTVADVMGGDGDGAPDSRSEDSWIHPERPVLLADRMADYSKLKRRQRQGKKSKVNEEAFDEYQEQEKGAWDDFKNWIEVKTEMLKQQDPNPLWRSSLLKMEGHFGAGIGSVFRLYRWFFVMNLYIAATWGIFVIAPVLAQEYYGTEVPTIDTVRQSIPMNMSALKQLASAGQTAIQSSYDQLFHADAPVRLALRCDTMRCLNVTSSCSSLARPVEQCGLCALADAAKAGCTSSTCCTSNSSDWPSTFVAEASSSTTNTYKKSFDFDWFFYNGYHWTTSFNPDIPGYRIDMAYVMVVLVLYLANIVAVIRELAESVGAEVRSRAEENVESMRFPLTKELFGGYKHGLATNEAVQAHLTGLRNTLKAIMGTKMEQRVTENQRKVLFCIPVQTSRRILGSLAAFGLVLMSGFGIWFVMTYRNELDNKNAVLVPAILTFIKQVIPLLVRKTVALEKYVDAEKAMKATVSRVYFLKMFSLVNMFVNNLNQLTQNPNAGSESAPVLYNSTDWATEGLLATAKQQNSCVETEIGKAYLKLILVDMLVGIIQQFKLYPQWRVAVFADRRKVTRDQLVTWLKSLKLDLDDKSRRTDEDDELEIFEDILRKFLGEKCCGRPINLETIREMDTDDQTLDKLKRLIKQDGLQLRNGAWEPFITALNALKDERGLGSASVISSDDKVEQGESSDLNLTERTKGQGLLHKSHRTSLVLCDQVGTQLQLAQRLQGGDRDSEFENPVSEQSQESSAEVNGGDEELPLTNKEKKKQLKLEKAQAKALARLEKERAKAAAYDSILRADAKDRSNEHSALDQATLELIDQRNKEEYDTDRAAQAAIDMMYRQALIWVGASFCPVLPFFGLLNISVQFYVQYFSMFKSCKPPKTPWSANKTMYFFMKLVLVTLLISGGPIVFVLTRDSMSCGPHCSISKMQSHAPWLLDDADKSRCNPATLPPAFVGAADRWMGDRAPWLQATVSEALKVLLTAPVMFSLLFVGCIGVYFMLKVEGAMLSQIDAMGALLDDEEQQRYDLIMANTKAGVNLIIPSTEGKSTSLSAESDAQGRIPNVLRHGLRTRLVDQDVIDKKRSKAVEALKLQVV